MSNHANIEGSPFLFEEWRTGKITLRNNRFFENVQLKFDVYNNKFFYNKNDSLYEILDDVVEIRLKDNAHLQDTAYDMIFRNTIHIPNKLNQAILYRFLLQEKWY